MNGITHETRQWVKTILIAVIIALIINKGLIVNATVPTSSMENTIMVGDRIVANRLAYLNQDPERGDIVIFNCVEDDDKLYVKRLIGLPGDKVNIVEGIVYVNGEKLEEDYKDRSDKRSFGPYIVPIGHYFFLGDNRTNSKDSRLWSNPYIAEDNIVGEVLFRYYPSLKNY